MTGGRVPRLVDGNSPGLLLDVLDVLRRAGLDRGHGLDDVPPRELRPALGVGDGERHRAALLDHRR